MNVVVQCLAEATRWQHCTKYREESFFMSGLQVTWSEVGEVIFRKCCTESEKLNTTHYIFFFIYYSATTFFFLFLLLLISPLNLLFSSGLETFPRMF